MSEPEPRWHKRSCWCSGYSRYGCNRERERECLFESVRRVAKCSGEKEERSARRQEVVEQRTQKAARGCLNRPGRGKGGR